MAIAPCDVLSVYDHRTLWPATQLKRAGEIELIEAEEPTLRFAMRRHGPPEPLGLKNPPEADVMVFTRLLAGRIVRLIPMLQAHGIAVCVDIDDDFRHCPPRMGGREKIDPRHSPEYNWRHLVDACKQADFVTCSSDALTAYAPHGRVAVIRNCVPARYLEVSAPRDGATVGWSGSVSQHPGDLEVTHGGVARALEVHGAAFMVIGERDGVRRALGLATEPWATGMVSHAEYIRKLAELDVGIAPLADNAYTRAKSALKLLQYMALGIPWIASPSPEHDLIHADALRAASEAAGALCKPRGREWARAVLEALRTPLNAREEAAQASRAFISERWTIERRAHQWAEAWEQAWQNRRRTPAT